MDLYIYHNNVKKIAESQGITMKYLVQELGMTEAGYYRSLQKKSLKLSVVHKTAGILGVSMSSLIEVLDEKDSINLVSEPGGKFVRATNTEVNNMKELLKAKNETIEILKGQLSYFTEAAKK